MATVELSPAEKKIMAIKILEAMPPNFRWTIAGTTYALNELTTMVKDGRASEETIELVSSLSGGFGKENQLGKRYRCLVCGAEILCTKAGSGTAQCCEQQMVVQVPKPVPSSD